MTTPSLTGYRRCLNSGYQGCLALALVFMMADAAQADMTMRKGQWTVSHTVEGPNPNDPVDSGTDSLCLADDTLLTIDDVEADLRADIEDIISTMSGKQLPDDAIGITERIDTGDRFKLVADVDLSASPVPDLVAASASFEQIRTSDDTFEVVQRSSLKRVAETEEQTRHYKFTRTGECQATSP